MIALLKQFITYRFKLMGARAQYYSTVLMAVLIELLIIGSLLLAGLLLVGLALGFALGAWFNSMALGMLAAAGIYFFIAIIFYFCRAYLQAMLQGFVDKRMTKFIAAKDAEDE